ncbi:MAG: pre-peptidase C-terminal domain-containing protein [Phormidesmis sp.]
MKFMNGKFPRVASHRTQKRIEQGILAAAVMTGIVGVADRAAFAQSLLQQEGTLAPMEDTYTFDGESGQTMTIELQSEEFDTVLLLKGPDGEVLTSNDDYGGTLNSVIVVELPESGTYSAIASSFSGQGGSYAIEVRPASEYEQVFSRAYDLSVSEDYEASIEAYTAAIELDESDPGAYLGRAEATINQAYLTSSIDISGPSDLPEEVIEAVVADYLKAADLLDQQGQTGPAESLREQVQYFTGESPAGPSDDPTSDIDPGVGIPPEVEMLEPAEPMPAEEPMPVEPDGGIGDGAEPVPDPAG